MQVSLYYHCQFAEEEVKFREAARSHTLAYRKGELRSITCLGPCIFTAPGTGQAQDMVCSKGSIPPSWLPGYAGFSSHFALAGCSRQYGYLPEFSSIPPSLCSM